MGRAVHFIKSNIYAIAGAVLLVGAFTGLEASIHHQKTVAPVVQTAAPTTQLTYRGVEGKSALELLKQHAKVQTKTSAGLGEFVVAINGNNGGGKKYWLYDINGKEAQVGAGAYITHDGEIIKWKLQ